jgi:PhnB protein
LPQTPGLNDRKNKGKICESVAIILLFLINKKTSTMKTKPIPEGFHTVTPYLVVSNAGKLIEFMKKAFDAKKIYHFKRPDGTIMHAVMQVGDSMIMLADATEKYPAKVATLYLYVPDTDAVYKKAMTAGATSIMEPADQFYGDRNAGVTDASGVQWWIGTHIEDVSEEELEKRQEKLMSKAQ